MNQENLSLQPDAQYGTGVVIDRNAKIGKQVTIGPYTVVHAHVVIGDNVTIGSHCVLGVLPSRNARMRESTQELSPLVLGAHTQIGNHAVLYAGTTLGPNVFFGDYASVREEVRIGEYTVIGRMATVELNTSIGSRCVIQTLAYVTADSVVEDDVFIGPCVSMSNDKYMGQTSDPMRGPTIRSGAKIGARACLLPGVEIGAESVIGAGSVVTKDVISKTTVIGCPAHTMRNFINEEA